MYLFQALAFLNRYPFKNKELIEELLTKYGLQSYNLNREFNLTGNLFFNFKDHSLAFGVTPDLFQLIRVVTGQDIDTLYIRDRLFQKLDKDELNKTQAAND
jgi:hypothetical protein